MSSEFRGHRGWFPNVASLVIVASLASVPMGCDKSADVTEILAEARTAAFQGNTEQAIASYEQVLEIEPQNVSALLGIADIYIQEGSLNEARVPFEQLDTLELMPSDQQRVGQSRNRLWRLIYDDSKGEGPANPADAASYEDAIINLYNADPTEALALEISQRFVYEARRALGAADVTVPLSQNEGLLEAATADQLRAGLAGYQRLTQRDERLLRVLLTDEDIRREAEAMEVILTERVFFSDFTQLFEANTREQLVAVEGFLPETNMFRIFLGDQYDGPRLEGEELEQFKAAQALRIVLQQLNTLALQVRGESAAGIPNPPARLFGEGQAEIAAFFAGFEVVSFEIARRGEVTLEVLIPFDLLLKTAYRQEEYIAWWKEQHPEGVTPPTVQAREGTGEGTGDGVTAPIPTVPQGEGTGSSAAETEQGDPEEGTATEPSDTSSESPAEGTAEPQPE